MMPTRISGALDEVLGAGHPRADQRAEGVLVTEGLDRVVLMSCPRGPVNVFAYANPIRRPVLVWNPELGA